MNLFNRWHELFWDVGSNSLVFKLQLGVVLLLQRLEDSYNFTVLPGATSLLLVGEVEPAENIHSLNHVTHPATLPVMAATLWLEQ